MMKSFYTCLIALFALQAQAASLLHVSYDPTREFYDAYNKEFVATHEGTNIRMSHGGSGKQARAVIDGLNADVVSLTLSYDVDMIAERTGKLPKDWASALPNKSVPMSSTIVLLVRKGNPKAIKDWPDLIRADVDVVTPNPKTSGGARWNYLAAYAYGLHAFKQDKKAALEFVAQLFGRVKILDASARSATTTFVQRGMGDVLIAWENEAYLAQQQFTKGEVEIVYPSRSIRADTPVAVVAGNAQANGNAALAKAYAEGLFAAPAQALAARFHFRPIKGGTLPSLPMATVDELGGWQKLHEEHFAEGAAFDQMMANVAR